MSAGRGLKIISSYDTSGYATAARRVLLALRDAGVPFTWTPMVPGTGWDLAYEPFTGSAVGDPDLDPYCNRPLAYDTVLVQLVPEYLLRLRLAEPDVRLVAATVWETDRLPHHWRFFLELADLVLVPCAWNADVFRAADLRVPVEIFPHLVPAESARGGALPWPVPDSDFVFYAVEVWSARKALDDVVRCYLDTFTARDPVTLVVKTDARALTHPTAFGGFRRPSAVVARMRAARAEPARVVVVEERVSHDTIAALHARGDCYVSLSHGEGFGLGIVDAAAQGSAVITTAFGAPLEYLPTDAAWLVRARLVPVDDDLGKPSLLPDQRWAQADPIHASALLREAASSRVEAARRGARLAAAVRARFDPRVLIPRLLALLDGVPAR